MLDTLYHTVGLAVIKVNDALGRERTAMDNFNEQFHLQVLSKSLDEKHEHFVKGREIGQAILKAVGN